MQQHVILWQATHHLNGAGVAYALNTWHYRFCRYGQDNWQTVTGDMLTLDAASGTEAIITDPARPTRAEVLA